MSLPDLDLLPDLPLDEDGPVFKAPWQAQSFAIAVSLQEQGIFTWQEWAEQLGSTIESARAGGDPDLGNTYYEHWLATLEIISTNKGLTNSDLLAARKKQVHDEHQKLHGHPH